MSLPQIRRSTEIISRRTLVIIIRYNSVIFDYIIIDVSISNSLEPAASALYEYRSLVASLSNFQILTLSGRLYLFLARRRTGIFHKAFCVSSLERSIM